MNCKERIKALEAAVNTISQQINQLDALPNSDSDASIIAAIQQLEAQKLSLEGQLASERASCNGNEAAMAANALPEARAKAARAASEGIETSHTQSRKAALTHARSVHSKSKALQKAFETPAKPKNK